MHMKARVDDFSSGRDSHSNEAKQQAFKTNDLVVMLSSYSGTSILNYIINIVTYTRARFSSMSKLIF